MKVLLASVLVVAALAGCGSTSPPAADASSAAGVGSRVITDFDLYTHCGVRETRIGDDYYEASPVLGDGNGNPPAGWGNPGQLGTMTVRTDGTAHFSAPDGLEADFRIRPGATTWTMICS